MATGERGKKGSSPPRRLSLLTNDIVPSERTSERYRRARRSPPRGARDGQMKTRNASNFSSPLQAGWSVCVVTWITLLFGGELKHRIQVVPS